MEKYNVLDEASGIYCLDMTPENGHCFKSGQGAVKMDAKKEVIDIDDPRFRITPSQQVLASCTGAVVTSLFVTPLDVVKIRLQAQKKTAGKCYLYCNGLMDHLCNCSENSKWFEPTTRFNGTMDAFLKISRNEGVTSLWSGLSPTLVLAIPATIIYFVTYEQLRLKLKDEYNKDRPIGAPIEQPVWIPLAAGGTARIFSVSLVSPMELVRTKMQSAKLSYFEIGEALRVLIQLNGVSGLWKGIFATLLRDVPFSAIYWTSYENIKAHFYSGVPSFGFSFAAGAFSGGLAAAVTVPFDVVKTHQQIEIGNKVFSNEAPKADSTFTLLGKIYRQYGLNGLFTGLVPRLIKVAPACAIMIATFEHSKVAFSRLANTNSETETVPNKPADFSVPMQQFAKTKEPTVIDINVQTGKTELM